MYSLPTCRHLAGFLADHDLVLEKRGGVLGDRLQLLAELVAMARRPRIATIAEGVESERQRDFLRAVGCDDIQGYVLARPMPADACEAWLRAHEATRIVTAA